MNSTPEQDWADFYRQTHQGTELPSWELSDDDTQEDEVEWDGSGT